MRVPIRFQIIRRTLTGRSSSWSFILSAIHGIRNAGVGARILRVEGADAESTPGDRKRGRLPGRSLTTTASPASQPATRFLAPCNGPMRSATTLPTRRFPRLYFGSPFPLR